LNRAKYPLVCFKPICDSHLIRELPTTFAEGHLVWAYRHYTDVANSSLRKFEHATRAIRLVCTGQPGAGWFGEGLSSEVAEELRSLYEAETLSDFDLACLVWWARNQIMLDSGLAGRPSVTLVKYETLVTNPK